MSANIPQINQAGDTWSWSAAWSDYPSGTWTLSAVIKTANEAPVTLTTSAEVDGSFSISYQDHESALLTEGSYTYVLKVTDGTSTYTLQTGTLKVIPDLATTDATYDTRTFNRRMMEALEAVLEGTSDNDVLETTIGTRTFKSMTRNELLRHYAHFKRLVSIENGASLFKPVRLI